jgi:hypothetical protein
MQDSGRPRPCVCIGPALRACWRCVVYLDGTALGGVHLTCMYTSLQLYAEGSKRKACDLLHSLEAPTPSHDIPDQSEDHLVLALPSPAPSG